MTGRGARSDGGFTTVVALGLVCVLGVLTAFVTALGVLRVSRHRAESAADLAALAAAQHAREGPQAACAAARATAAAQGAGLDRCALDGLDAVVQVSLALPGQLHPFGPLRSRARAGER